MTHEKTKKATIHLRIDTNIKRHLEKVLASNGMSISEAIRLYLWQIVTQGGVPFKGFSSTKLLPKTAEPSKLEQELAQNYTELQLSLVRNQLKKVKSEDEQVRIDAKQDKEMVRKYIERYNRARGIVIRPHQQPTTNDPLPA